MLVELLTRIEEVYEEYNATTIIWSGVIVIGGAAGIAYLVANDSTMIGVVDDMAIVPLTKIVWDNVVNIANTTNGGM